MLPVFDWSCLIFSMKTKNKFSFLCIDDDAALASLCAAVQLKGPVALKPESPPATWEAAISGITERLTSRKFDGLLLDFRLDEFPIGDTNAKVKYTAESLINELRRQSVEGTDKSYPVILWSTAVNLAWYFSINPSYTGLYDGIWDKEEVRADAPAYGKRLAAIASGYSRLHTAAKKGEALHIVLNCRASAVLAEMEQAFTAKIKQAPYAFNYATFIINRILRCNGVLVDQATVAAILGITPSAAAAAVIGKLGTAASPIRYSGVFAGHDERYWRDDLLSALNQLAPSGRWLHLGAAERVAILKKKLRLQKLTAAGPIHPSYQTDFDCICSSSRQPLARRNGYRLHPKLLDPWIEPLYIAGTVYRTMSKANAKRIHLDVGEQERFEADFSK